MSQTHSEPVRQIGLADAIAVLRAELSKARRQALGEDVTFSVGEIEVELALEFGFAASAKSGFQVFSFINLGGEAGLNNKSSHKLKLKLTIDPPGEPSRGAIQDDTGPTPVKQK
jgi:hypothetical protein